MVDKEGGIGMEDAAGFFANVFGGERFKDYVSPSRLWRAHAHSARSALLFVDWRDFVDEGDDLCGDNDDV